MPTYLKDPDAVLDYGFDWSNWLAAGETIDTSAWLLDGVAFTGTSELKKDSDNHSTTATSIWLSDGIAGGRYAITNHIKTTMGREDDRTMTITVKER